MRKEVSQVKDEGDFADFSQESRIEGVCYPIRICASANSHRQDTCAMASQAAARPR